MDTALSIRQLSLEHAKNIGCEVYSDLPLIENIAVCRTVDQVVDRILAMFVVAATVYGFPRGRAKEWLDREQEEDLTTQPERRFLDTGIGDTQQFASQIEGIWALYWSIFSGVNMDFSTTCPDNFVQMLPDIKASAHTKTFRHSAMIRPDIEISSQCDLAYLLHHAMVTTSLRQQHDWSIKPYIVVERRRALEWLISTNPWEDITLDT
jgi:hypothetical protein